MVFKNPIRRIATLAMVALMALSAHAQDWRARYPTLVYAQASNENATTKTEALTPIGEYLSKKLGVKVQMRIVNDYAAVIEGQRSGHIHIALHGASSYARGIMTGVKMEPFATDIYKGNNRGYYAVFFVRKDSSYKTIQDLKGKNLGLVDANSTSGGTVPLYAPVLMRMPSLPCNKALSTLLRTGGTTRPSRTSRGWTRTKWRTMTTSEWSTSLISSRTAPTPT